VNELKFGTTSIRAVSETVHSHYCAPAMVIGINPRIGELVLRFVHSCYL
jgi:hypothetical protein